MHLWLIELQSKIIKPSELLNADLWDKTRVCKAGKLHENWKGAQAEFQMSGKICWFQHSLSLSSCPQNNEKAERNITERKQYNIQIYYCVDLQGEYGFYFSRDLQILDVHIKIEEKKGTKILSGRYTKPLSKTQNQNKFFQELQNKQSTSDFSWIYILCTPKYYLFPPAIAQAVPKLCVWSRL